MPRIADPASPAKKKLLDAAERLMLEKGYTATSVDDICAKAGLTKGSFFHYFESKDALGKAVLKHAMVRQHEAMAAAPFQKLSEPAERIFGRIDFVSMMSGAMFEDPETRAGCLIGTLAQELSYTHPDIRNQCADCLQEVAQGIEGDLAALKKSRGSKSRIDPHGLAEHFIAVMEGSFVIAKAQQSPRIIQANLAHFKKYLECLIGK